ncbi:hypothetical protein EXU34_23540 [Alteromonas sp. ZYF713]|nr:hypothetical protein [Alteromonas sp. ZYF713]
MVLAFAILVIAAAAVPTDDKGSEDLKKKVMKQIGEVRRFFREDPLGQKIIDQLQDLISIAKSVRQRIRKRLGEYLKNLENE